MLKEATHKTILVQILKDICSDKSLAPVLGFKGGTAAYLFYGLGRFSMGLDFDLLEESSQDLVFERLDKILSNFGTIREKYNKRNTILYVISYEDRYQNIKVEVSKRSFNSKYEPKSYMGLTLLVMVKEDMFAHKLSAMFERGANTSRDIYDVWFFLKNNWSINEEIIKLRTDMGLNEFIDQAILVLEKVNNSKILNGVGELLDEKQKAWARDNLKNDTIFLLKLRKS